MSSDREKYLLRYQSQIDAFRESHKDELRQYAGAYRRWIQSLTMMKWVPLQLRPEDEEVVIGIICILYVDKFVNISFSDDMRCIRNEPRNEQERLAWMKATGWHGPGIDQPKNEK